MGKGELRWLILLLNLSLLLAVACGNTEPTATPTATPQVDKDIINWHLEWSPDGYFRVWWSDYTGDLEQISFIAHLGEGNLTRTYHVSSDQKEQSIPLELLIDQSSFIRCLQVKSSGDSSEVEFNPIGESKKVCWGPCSLPSRLEAVISNPENPRKVDLFRAESLGRILDLLTEKEKPELHLSLGETAIVRVWFNPHCGGDEFGWSYPNPQWPRDSNLEIEDLSSGNVLLIPIEKGEGQLFLRIFNMDEEYFFEIPIHVIVSQN